MKLGKVLCCMFLFVSLSFLIFFLFNFEICVSRLDTWQREVGEKYIQGNKSLFSFLINVVAFVGSE